MRKYIFILLAAIAIVGTSCQKEEKLILGTWEATSLSGTITDDDGEVLFSGTFPISAIPGMKISIEFKKDNTCTSTYQFLADAESETDTYSIKDNTLYVDGEAINIRKLDKKEMILDMEFEGEKLAVTFKKV